MPTEPTGAHLTSEQRTSLLSLCHKVQYRFCGSLKIPRFDNWTLIRSGYQVQTFVFEPARYGYQDYINDWFEEHASSSKGLPSPMMTDALLKANIETYLITCFQGRPGLTQSLGLNLSTVASNSNPFNLQFQLETYGDLGKRLPSFCWLPSRSEFGDWQVDGTRSVSLHPRSTTHIIIFVLRCIQSNLERTPTSKELRLGMIAKSLEFQKKHSALEEEISGIMKVAKVSSTMPKIGNPVTKRFSLKRKTPPHVLIMAVFSPLWAVQWAARNTAAYGGPT